MISEYLPTVEENTTKQTQKCRERDEPRPVCLGWYLQLKGSYYLTRTLKQSTHLHHYIQTSWWEFVWQCMESPSYMYIYNIFTYTIYIGTWTRELDHSPLHVAQNNHTATLGVTTVIPGFGEHREEMIPVVRIDLHDNRTNALLKRFKGLFHPIYWCSFYFVWSSMQIVFFFLPFITNVSTFQTLRLRFNVFSLKQKSSLKMFGNQINDNMPSQTKKNGHSCQKSKRLF